jgi:hypothetical protein
MSTNGKLSREYAYLFRLLHWVLTGSIVILILTGFSLHAGARPEWSIFAGVVPDWLWEGRVYVWHFWSAVVFFPAIIGSLIFFFQKRVWWRLTQLILVVGALITALTGVWMMFPFGSTTTMKVVVGIHAAAGLLLIPLAMLWHVVLGFSTNLRYLVPSFRPFRGAHWKPLVMFLPVVIITTWILFDGWPLRAPWRKLVASQIATDDAGSIDLGTLPWSDAKPLKMRLVNGSGFVSGQTDLTLQALHNGQELFIKAQWDDPREDHNYWPWKRHEDGWEYLQTSSKDEMVHYEDKFSLVFPLEPSFHFDRIGCAIHCHLDGDYGWGYKGGVPDIDVWHWKAARTGSVGQVDDKYWSLVDFENKDVGRHGDPKDGGGYEKNVSEDLTHPPFLPRGPEVVVQGAIPAATATEYNDETAALYPPGSTVPGVVTAAFEGDRGNVTCQTEHRDDRWTLYIRRKLDTQSPHDVKFVPGESHPFGAAAFDHAGKRHTYSMPVFHLELVDGSS